MLKEGDDVTIVTIGGGEIKPVWEPSWSPAMKTEMSEYDASFVYVPLEQLQAIRGMQDPAPLSDQAQELRGRQVLRDERAPQALPLPGRPRR